MTVWVYMLQGNDGSYYVGSTRGSLEARVAEHDCGIYPGYTSTRRPVRLIWSQDFQSAADAIAVERRLKGWRREKKQALIAGDLDALPLLSRRGPHPSSPRVGARPQDEAATTARPHPEEPRSGVSKDAGKERKP